MIFFWRIRLEFKSKFPIADSLKATHAFSLASNNLQKFLMEIGGLLGEPFLPPIGGATD